MNGIDDEIASDFLVEAGEIVDRLGEELVALENSPDDIDLLNAVFRGFHTIKGGAGFLNFVPMVDLCHAVEDPFNDVRAGTRILDHELFDAAQCAVDELAQMISALVSGHALESPSEDVMSRLHQVASPQPPTAPDPVKVVAPVVVAASGSEPISDDEFEALLDMFQAQGPGGPPTAPIANPPPPPAPAPAAKPAPRPAAAKPQSSPGQTRAEPAESTVRVDTKRLDAIVNLIGELVLARNRLKTLRLVNRNEQQDRAVATLDQVTTRLQSAVMKTRMQPVGRVLSRFPKLARDVARSVHKEVELELVGAETELDRTLVDALADPLVHLVRNAIDHGIEPPDERVRAGKPRIGSVRLSAQQEGDHIAIEVRDDGSGMDPERLRAKAIEKGLLDHEAASRLSAEECLQLVFMAGFSTKAEVSEISGRGVGMDVVQSRVKELSGRITIESERGKGSCFLIRVPLTLAIMPTLMVMSGGCAYALPLVRVAEIFSYDADRLRWIDSRRVLDLRHHTLPLLLLHEWLGSDIEPTSSPCVVLLQSGNTHFGLLVDSVKGREEVVIKPLPRRLLGLPGYSGATLTGDGKLALILDIDGLATALSVV